METSVLYRVTMNNRTVWVPGEHGMVGKSVCRIMRLAGANLLTNPRRTPDLLNREETLEYAKHARPEVIVMAAGKVGGILPNSRHQVEFLTQNARMAFNVLEAAHACGAQKVVYLGSSCIYPRLAPQPMKPESLLTSALEPTNEAYALAKLAGVRLCHYYRKEYGRDFIAVLPCNLYGPGDTYDLEHSHVIPAFMLRFHDALARKDSSVTCLGDGSAKREFLYVEDLARAIYIIIRHYHGEEPINVGSGKVYSIAETAQVVANTVGFTGEIKWDGVTASNGMPVKVMDSSEMLALNWQPQVSLEMGLQLAYDDFKERLKNVIDIRDETMPRALWNR